MDDLAAVLGIVVGGENQEDPPKQTRAKRRRGKQEADDDVEDDDDEDMGMCDDDEAVVRLQCAYWDTSDPVQVDSVPSRSQQLSRVSRVMSGAVAADDESGSASSATRERRGKIRKKRSVSCSHRSVPLGFGDEFPDGFESRASNGSVSIEDLDDLRHQFDLYPSSGASSSSSASVPSPANPNATPWLDKCFVSLMENLTVATPRGGILHYDAAGRESTAREIQAHRRSLPVFTTTYEEHLLVQSGNAPNPLLVDNDCVPATVVDQFQTRPPRRVFWPSCCNGAKCIFHSCTNIYGKESKFELRCILFEDEFHRLCELGQVEVDSPRPCVLCCRARAQQFVLASRVLEGHVSVDMSTNHQVYQNLVGADGGFAEDFVLRPGAVYAGFFSPIAVFRESLLSVSFDRNMQLWRVDQSSMFYKKVVLPPPRAGEHVMGF